MPGSDACTPAGVRFAERRERPAIANIAIAREQAGWCWSLAVLDDCQANGLMIGLIAEL
jgi:hypothetical protein